MSNTCTHPRNTDRLQLLTVAETAQLLQVDQKTVRRKIDRRELPYVKVGRAVRIRYSDVARFVDAQTIPAVTGRGVV